MMDAKRKVIPKSIRMTVYQKCHGHCAYCGCDLEYKDMQVDHVVPLNGWSERAPHNRMKEYGIEKLAKEMAVRGGVTRITATVHVYRKTFASVLYRKTGDVLLVSKLLGHAKPDMTVQYYLIDDIEEMQHKYNRVA